MNISEIEQEYSRRLNNYKRLMDESLYIIEEGISGIKTSSILSRIKTLNSFKDKVIRKEVENPFEEINDILGIRIVALFRSDLEDIFHIIHDLFEVISKDNKLVDAPVDSFGYLSVHYIVKLKSDYTGPRYNGLHNICFEIQVRTIAMDAWATISHYLDYKTSHDVPKELLKDFYALSGLFYLADTHFEIFYNSRLESGETSRLEIEASKDYSEQEINLDTLSAYLEIKFKDREEADLQSISEIIRELHGVGYYYLDVLDKKLINSKLAFEKYEKRYPPGFQVKFNRIGIVRVSLSIIDSEFREARKLDKKNSSQYEEFDKFIERKE